MRSVSNGSSQTQARLIDVPGTSDSTARIAQSSEGFLSRLFGNKQRGVYFGVGFKGEPRRECPNRRGRS